MTSSTSNDNPTADPVEAALDSLVASHDANLWFVNAKERPATKYYLDEAILFNRVKTDDELTENLRTKCCVTADMVRHALSGTDGANQWQTVEQCTGPICQIEYNAGDHILTYLPHRGLVYHSYFKRFGLTKINIAATVVGAVGAFDHDAAARLHACLFPSTASLGSPSVVETQQPAIEEIAIYVPPTETQLPDAVRATLDNWRCDHTAGLLRNPLGAGLCMRQE